MRNVFNALRLMHLIAPNAGLIMIQPPSTGSVGAKVVVQNHQINVSQVGCFCTTFVG